MRITSVTFRELISGPGYQNKAIEAAASVEKGETPEDALFALAQWVKAQLRGDAVADIQELRNEVNFLHRQRQQLRGAVAQAEAELKRAEEKKLIDAGRAPDPFVDAAERAALGLDR